MSEQQPSRVVHLRLRNSTILTCHKLLELQQGEFDIPMSTMLVTVLDNLTDKLVNSGKLPSIADENAAIVLDAIYKEVDLGDDEEEPESNLPEPDMLEDFCSDVKVSDEDVEDNLSIHNIPLDKEFQKRSPDEQQIVEEEINYPDNPPWETNTDYKTFTQLKITSPKDMLIESAENSEHLQRCIEMIYSVIPMDMWGSPRAHELVAEVLPTVEHYLGPVIVHSQLTEETSNDS